MACLVFLPEGVHVESGVTETDLFVEILLVAAAAFIGAAVAHVLRLPTIIGFLAAGVAIGPSTPGPVGDIENISRAADVGVVLLMFGIGVQFSFREFAQHPKLLLLGGGAQIVATLALAVAVGRLLQLGWEASVVLGFLTAISSTAVAVKVLEGQQRLRSLEGIAVINVLIFQDIAAVLMVLAVPSLGGDSLNVFEIVLALVKGILLIAFAYVLSTRILPRAWQWIANARSRELSLLAVLTLAVGLATGSSVLGLSIAFGAFLAGMAVSENAYGRTALSDVIPLREVFASVFFVSMGMLIRPQALWEQPLMVASIVVLIVAGKGIMALAALKLAGLSLPHALPAALILSQVGEFSFVIARVSLNEGVTDAELGSAFLVAAVLSILLNPGLTRLGPPLAQAFRRVPGLRQLMEDAPETLTPDSFATLRRHVVVCGYGATASALVRVLSGRSFPFVVIDSSPFVLQRVRAVQLDIPFIYGDATHLDVLELARVDQARTLVVTLPNAADAQVVITQALALNPDIDVVSRGSPDGRGVLRQAGATEVVDPEFETSLEIVRHVLHRIGVSATEIAAMQARWRGDHYRNE
jgi:CPA2 family monovalent cation:H+ antiporter-2